MMGKPLTWPDQCWFLLVKVLAERPSGEVSLEVVDEMVEYFTGELKY